MKREYYSKQASGSRILLLLAVLLFTNCSSKKDSREVLVKTYVENIVAEETYSYNRDSLIYHRDKIFKENNITPEAFHNQLKELKDKPEAWDLFFKQSNEMLDSLRRTGKIN